MFIHVYIYIWIERERDLAEDAREVGIKGTYAHTHIHI